MKLYLTGFMGAGKTTIGAELARRFEVPFFDLDEIIQASEGKSIKQIFEDSGEPYFRKRERDVLRSTRYLEHGVIATGGGTFTFEDNIQFISSEGFSIFLSVPYAVLGARVGEKAEDRPLFQNDVATHELFQHRLKFYKTADLTLEIHENESISEVVERLSMLLPKEILVSFPRRERSASR